MFGLQVRKVGTLGVRVPLWPDAVRFMASLPFALLASSANPSGSAPRALGEVDPGLLNLCDVVLDGGVLSGLASSIVDLSTYAADGRWRLLRTGSVGEEGIAKLLAPGSRGSTAVRTLPFYQVDVFTEKPFAGNALAVFPACEGLTAAQMQSIVER